MYLASPHTSRNQTRNRIADTRIVPFNRTIPPFRLIRVHGSKHEVLQNRTGFSKAEANGPEQWKATSRKAISAPESAEAADVICECRFYGRPFARVAHEETGSGLPLAHRSRRPPRTGSAWKSTRRALSPRSVTGRNRFPETLPTPAGASPSMPTSLSGAAL